MTLYFITGNENKFKEVKHIIKNIEKLDLDLPEIQEINAQKIINAKLLEALNHKTGEFIVEDTSLYLKGLNGLPGPLIKWFMKTMGNEGLFKLTEKMNDFEAEARTIIGYAKSNKEIYYFEGSIKGKIVNPLEKTGFGWDCIFQPKGYSKSFSEFTLEEKNKISMRKIAVEKLKTFIEKK